MNKIEVLMLVRELVENYPDFDQSEKNISRLQRHLEDFPYDRALKNVRQHILTKNYPPTRIAEFRGGIGSLQDAERLRESGRAYLEQMEQQRQLASPPPQGLKEELYAKLYRNSET
ncbi:hypothetical protein [Paenibacillus macerans]|uniref:Replicative helicase inhibitor G39P N-terminal domain-containing protein n=1 Tax=Paenibacillus macerans TaxID=44252 RepID=A0A090Y3X9_PAEMA|nr:hypothetical protein [Paenibacillus macerans]KFM93124.1 hypothetical protein DJ90_2972 [Paenibacillus macerans]MCY7561577.1 hypothetical protein [Paenibacillus macerans]MEC0153324.1 hypothetical protein [Paenibacillus macerans]SUA84820.1 Uncharacterised protein [Paenibacillus macerans]